MFPTNNELASILGSPVGILVDHPPGRNIPVETEYNKNSWIFHKDGRFAACARNMIGFDGESIDVWRIYMFDLMENSMYLYLDFHFKSARPQKKILSYYWFDDYLVLMIVSRDPYVELLTFKVDHNKRNMRVVNVIKYQLHFSPITLPGYLPTTSEILFDGKVYNLVKWDNVSVHMLPRNPFIKTTLKCYSIPNLDLEDLPLDYRPAYDHTCSPILHQGTSLYFVDRIYHPNNRTRTFGKNFMELDVTELLYSKIAMTQKIVGMDTTFHHFKKERIYLGGLRQARIIEDEHGKEKLYLLDLEDNKIFTNISLSYKYSTLAWHPTNTLLEFANEQVENQENPGSKAYRIVCKKMEIPKFKVESLKNIVKRKILFGGTRPVKDILTERESEVLLFN